MAEGLPVDLYTVEQFEIALEAARWPRYAETALTNGQNSLEAVINRIKLTRPELTDIKVLESGDTLAVIACDPVNGNVFIAFDPTKEYTLEPFNLKFWRNSHPLGGAAHHGYSADLEYKYAAFGDEENGTKKSLVDSLEESILELADNITTAVTVTFSGFSKGGVQAVLASGQMLANGVFDDPDNIRLDSVYSFASPNYGTHKFVNKYDEVAEEKGVKVWNISISTDSLSRTFSSIYDKVGRVFSMSPDNSINDKDMTHSFNAYRDCLQKFKTALLSRNKGLENPIATNQVSGKLDI